MLHRYKKRTCHMGSHSVTCHPAYVRIPPLPPAEAGTRFSDYRVDLRPLTQYALNGICVYIYRPRTNPWTPKYNDC